MRRTQPRDYSLHSIKFANNSEEKAKQLSICQPVRCQAGEGKKHGACLPVGIAEVAEAKRQYSLSTFCPQDANRSERPALQTRPKDWLGHGSG